MTKDRSVNVLTRTASTRRRLVRRLSLVVALASAVGLVAVSLPAQATTGGATADSSITVSWATGQTTVGAGATASAATVKAAQVDHAKATSDGLGNDAGSGHWSDFTNLKVSVSQTTGLLDQTVTVSVSGMPESVTGLGVSNFLQVMQCWGANPNAADFASTCQWGGYSTGEVGGSGDSSVQSLFGQFADYTLDRGGVRFTSVQGEHNVDQAGSAGASDNRGLGDFFTASTSSEVPYLPVDSTGTGSANVTVQSAAQQQYLGCGAAAGQRCWLVVVPRGSHSGSLADGTKCGTSIPVTGNTYGGTMQFGQIGSPLAASCNFWSDRVVVPLDFDNPFSTCASGSTNRSVIGSELLSTAMSSWQSSLCAQTGSTYTLTTNSGDLARAQLLQGQTGLTAVSGAVTASTIGTADASLLDGTDLRYAPLANTSLQIGFVAEEGALDIDTGKVTTTVVTSLKLTPRLLAKMLTQSTKFALPMISGDWGTSTVGFSRAYLKNNVIFQDPEWIALGNPTKIAETGAGTAWVVAGPQGDDATRLLWQYVLADADAVAFLKGTPDPWGATINRYYLPPGNTNAADGGYDLLSGAISTFPKADRSVAPDKATADEKNNGQQLDSTAYAPYSGSFSANAARIAKVDLKITNLWDSSKLNGSGKKGGWLVSSPMLPNQSSGRLILGPVTASDADLYHLSAAQLALPLATTTTADTVASARKFVAATDSTVAATLAGQTRDAATGIATTNMTALSSGSYPLAMTLYAAVNLNSSALTSSARSDYAALLSYAAGNGNVKTGARGGLPDGYVPLTSAQQAQTTALATALTTPITDNTSGDTATQGPSSGDTATTIGAIAAQASAPSTQASAPATQITATPATATAAQSTATTLSPAQGVLGGSLVAGLGGLVASPFLMRRRGEGG